MSTTQELLAAKERYDALVTALKAEADLARLRAELPVYDLWDAGYKAGANVAHHHLRSILERL